VLARRPRQETRPPSARADGAGGAVTIRRLAPADFSLLAGYDWSPLVAERDTIYLFLTQDHARYCFAAEDGAGGTLGLLVGARSADGLSVFLFHVHVKASARSRGVGTALVRELELTARADGVERIWLLSRAEARGFYERLGFREARGLLAPEAARYVQRAKRSVVMAKDLGQSPG